MSFDAYARQRNFTDYSTSYPSSPHSGSWLDEEFDEIVRVISDAHRAVQLIQRSDGQLKNLSVGLDQLKPEIVLGTPTDWVTATDYEIKNVVWQAGVLYVCNSDHTSGVFATDLAAALWTAYLDYADPLGDAADYANAAKDYRDETAISASQAATSVTAAQAAQTAAEAAQAAAEAAVLAITLPLSTAEGGTGATTVAQARTNLGIGTADSPQFNALNIGAATDTTVTRASAGVIAVEGSNVLMASNLGVTVQGYDADTFFKDVGGTIAAETTFSAGAVFDRAVDANLATFGNATTTHDLLVRFASAGTLAELTPAPSGSADNTKGFGYDFTNGRWFCDTALNLSGQLLASAGSAAAPGVKVGAEQNGLCSAVTGTVSLVANGTIIATAGAVYFTVLAGVFAANGSAGSVGLGFNSDADTGMFRVGADNAGFAAGGVLTFEYNTTRVLLNTNIDLQLTTYGTPANGSVGPRRLLDASITTGTPVIADSGKRIIATGSVTIPASVFAKGDTLVIDAGSSSRTITQGGGLTLTWEASGSTGSRTLAAYGRCVVTFESATAATISGSLT